MMNKQDCLDLIRDLSNAPGASGFEDDVVSALRRNVSPLGRMEEDTLRNLYLYRNEHEDEKPAIQLDSHTDEVSFVVQAVKPNGTLRFLELGRWVAAGLTSQKVRVRNRFGEYIPGIIASTPPHFATEAQKHAAPDSASMTIDIGATSAEEAVNAYGIRIGEPVVADVSFHYDESHEIMMGKAFDCRLGWAAPPPPRRCTRSRGRRWP
jgi:putative aminopeptidase FrvX